MANTDHVNGPFAWQAVPTVISISPSSGSTAGGTPATIIGTSFQSGAVVTIGGKFATGVVFVDSTTITCVTPSGTEGLADVVVTNPDLLSGTLTDGFTYEAPPPPPRPPEPVVLRDIKRQRATVGPTNGVNAWPSSFVERLFGVGVVPVHFTEPDPRTSHENYYYNSRLNRLYVKISTSPVPVWRPIGG
jgi:hypothetical protein